MKPYWKCETIENCCENHSFIWISDLLKCIWYEIPRSGSTSFKHWIRLYPKYEFRIIKEQINPDEMIKRDGLQNYFKFAIARNPWDRFVSIFNLFKKHPQRIPQTEDLFNIKIENFTFKYFSENALEKTNHHWESCSKFIPKNHRLDFYCKIDNLTKDWEYIQNRLSISEELITPSNQEGSNKFFGFSSNHGKYIEYYDDYTKELIRKVYKDDIENFEFTFGENTKKRELNDDGSWCGGKMI